MIEITAIRLGKADDDQHTTGVRIGPGSGNEQITDVMWKTGTSQGQTTTQAIIGWLGADSDNRAVVAVGSVYVAVSVARPVNQPPYLSAQIDGVWTDHLLWLPIF
jgi:Protein of unknown function (DUF3892)